MKKELIINCPHCDQLIMIVELTCRIFRCGVLQVNGAQINPRLNKNVFDDLTTNNLIYGCGKPFVIYVHNKAFEYI